MLPDTAIKRIQSLSSISMSGKKVNGLFRLMEAPFLWEQAYDRIARNKGALTPGVDGCTFDGFSPDVFRSISERLKAGTYNPKPVRRIYIPKANGKKRPLGIPTTEDRLVQEVVRALLEQVYEPVFSEHSHGFRAGRSCHTALEHIQATWTGMKWLVDIDITGFFDNIDHGVLLDLLAERIEDRRFLALIRDMLEAGCVEDWVYRPTFTGTPQGGVVSPLLANIYLHELDCYMQAKMTAFRKGDRRASNPEWEAIRNKMATLRAKVKRRRERGVSNHDEADLAEIFRLTKLRAKLPASDAFDPGFRRLRYCRYADDFIIGVIGSKAEAKELMAGVQEFLASRLKLTVSTEKSGVRKAKDGAGFLGYEVRTYALDRPRMVRHQSGRRSIHRAGSDVLQLKVPRDRVVAFCKEKGYGDYEACWGKRRPTLIHASDVEIAMTFNAELRGLANYYALAKDVKTKLSKLQRIWRLSLGHTLANKHNTTVTRALERLRMGDGYGLAYQVQGRRHVTKIWSLKDLRRGTRKWGEVDLPPFAEYALNRTEVVERLNARECGACGRTDKPCEVHHVRKMADMIGAPLGQLAQAARRRKRVVLCRSCHMALHSGKLGDTRT